MTTQTLNTLFPSELQLLIISLNRMEDTEFERLQTAEHGPLVEDPFFEGELSAEDICASLMGTKDLRDKLISILEALPDGGLFEFALQMQPFNGGVLPCITPESTN